MMETLSGLIEIEMDAGAGGGAGKVLLNEPPERESEIDSLSLKNNEPSQIIIKEEQNCVELIDSEINDRKLVMANYNEPMNQDGNADQKRQQSKLIERERKILAQNEEETQTKERLYKKLDYLLHRSEFYSNHIYKKIEEDKKKLLKEKNCLPLQALANNSEISVKRKKHLSRDSSPKRVKDQNQTKSLKQDQNREEINKRRMKPFEEEEDQNQIAASGGGAVGNNENIDNSSRDDDLPILLTGATLRDYQKKGFEWLKLLYENGVNGCLADEMGLGKTIQCITLIAHLMEMGVNGPYLIVAPVSTLYNWFKEFKKFTPKIPVIVYHGPIENRKSLINEINVENNKKRGFPSVLVTSYNIVRNDCQILRQFEWRFLIVDEAQKIKNFNCKLFWSLKQIPSLNRLLMTGTPLQNNLAELWSLLNFLLPDIFDDLELFESWFNVESMQGESSDAEIMVLEKEKQIIAKMHKILNPFLLRRTKAEVEINLPPKKEIVVYAQMSVLQQHMYKAAVDQTIRAMYKGTNNEEEEDLQDMPRKRRKCQTKIDYSIFDSDDHEELPAHIVPEQLKDTVEKQIRKKVLNLNTKNKMMLLRKICNHPYLVDYPLDEIDGSFLVNEDIVLKCGKMLVLDSLLKALHQRNHKVIIFSQMVQVLDVIQDYLFYRGYKYGRLDGTTKFEEREEEICNFNENEDVFVFLVSTRAGGLGINLTSADTAIIYDSDWNPQVDNQAQDRCHRFGQTKPVIIYRLIVKNTVDEQILIRANAKKKLERLIIKNGRFMGGDPRQTKDVTLEDLQKLLEMSGSLTFELPADGELYSPEQLKCLMDRSDLIIQPKSGKVSSDSEINIAETRELFKVIAPDE